MATYVPVKHSLQTFVDSLGFSYSLMRLPGESVAAYRQRLILENEDRSGSTEQDLYRVMGRHLGQFDVKVFEITPTVSSPDPYIEITSTHCRAWYDYENEGYLGELNLLDRSNGYWLRDVAAFLIAGGYFTVTALIADWEFLKSDNLRLGKTDTVVVTEPLWPSQANNLEHDSIMEYYMTDTKVFQTLQGTLAEVINDGDYFVDEVNGVVWSCLAAAGSITYTYRDFPFTMYWQPVRCFALNDPDIQYLMYDEELDENGQLAHTKLNSTGAALINQVLAAHGSTWDKE